MNEASYRIAVRARQLLQIRVRCLTEQRDFVFERGYLLLNVTQITLLTRVLDALCGLCCPYAATASHKTFEGVSRRTDSLCVRSFRRPPQFAQQRG